MTELAEKACKPQEPYKKTEQKVQTNNLFKAKSLRRKKEAHTITAVMKRYTVQNGSTTLL